MCASEHSLHITIRTCCLFVVLRSLLLPFFNNQERLYSIRQKVSINACVIIVGTYRGICDCVRTLYRVQCTLYTVYDIRFQRLPPHWLRRVQLPFQLRWKTNCMHGHAQPQRIQKKHISHNMCKRRAKINHRNESVPFELKLSIQSQFALKSIFIFIAIISAIKMQTIVSFYIEGRFKCRKKRVKNQVATNHETECINSTM